MVYLRGFGGGLFAGILSTSGLLVYLKFTFGTRRMVVLLAPILHPLRVLAALSSTRVGDGLGR